MVEDRTVYRATSTGKWYFHDLRRGLKGGPFRWRWIAAINLYLARRKTR